MLLSLYKRFGSLNISYEPKRINNFLFYFYNSIHSL
ncbi:unnamed protein product, partial [Brassica rapa subsp. narinosa]